VPVIPPGVSSVEVAAGAMYTVVRRSDGNVVAWGDNSQGQCNGPALSPGLTYVEVAAGQAHTGARRSDGTVVAWGKNGSGQCNVPALPPGLTYVEVAAGDEHTVARRSDGSVAAWGRNDRGQCNVPALPAGMTFAQVTAGWDVTAAIIQAGAFHTFAAGCPGSSGVTRLDAAPPRVGTTTQIAMQPLPQNAAVLVLGFSNVSSAFGPLPLDLTAFGMPGCFGRVSPDFAASVVGSGGAATFPFAIPSLPALAGTILHSQAIVFDAAAGNPAGLVMSDAATLVVGP
jgi:hypothetical protein